MSGGHFDYVQHRITEAAEELKLYIARNHKSEYPFSKSVINKFKKAEKTIRLAANMLHEVDYLICADTGEESFTEGWNEKCKNV